MALAGRVVMTEGERTTATTGSTCVIERKQDEKRSRRTRARRNRNKTKTQHDLAVAESQQISNETKRPMVDLATTNIKR